MAVRKPDQRGQGSLATLKFGLRGQGASIMDKRQQAFEIVQQLSQEDLDTVVEEKGEKLQETTPSLFGALASKKKLTDRDFQKAKKSIVKDIDLGKKIKKPH